MQTTTKITLLALIASILLMAAAAQQFLGCCLDHNATDLTYKIYWGNLTTNSNCVNWCANAGYLYAGTKNGNECWCGNQYCTNGRLDPSSCNKPCAGNKNVKCGAVAINSVYKIPDPVLIGCFVTEFDTLVYKKKVLQATECTTSCYLSNYVYAAIYWGDSCYCGNSFSEQSQVPDSECNRPCSAGSLPCGGAGRVSVYHM